MKRDLAPVLKENLDWDEALALDITDKSIEIGKKIPNRVYRILWVPFVNDYLNRNNPRSKNPALRFYNEWRGDFHLVKNATEIWSKNSLSDAVEIRRRLAHQHVMYLTFIHGGVFLIASAFAALEKSFIPYFICALPWIRLPIDFYGTTIQLMTIKRIQEIIDKKDEKNNI